MRTIAIRNMDHGFWTETEVPVVKKENDIIVWCNHARVGHEIESIYQVSATIYCMTCPAYRDQYSVDWINAPCEGEHHG